MGRLDRYERPAAAGRRGAFCQHEEQTMHSLSKLIVIGAVAAAALAPAPPARAQEAPEVLIIGNEQILRIRAGDTLNGREMSVHDRISHVYDLLPKYLGGRFGRFTARPWRDRVHIYLNDEFILAVTPADARATGYKSAAQLGPIWLSALQMSMGRSAAQK
jgi:hypothetical protein